VADGDDAAARVEVQVAHALVVAGAQFGGDPAVAVERRVEPAVGGVSGEREAVVGDIVDVRAVGVAADDDPAVGLDEQRVGLVAAPAEVGDGDAAVAERRVVPSVGEVAGHEEVEAEPHLLLAGGDDLAVRLALHGVDPPPVAAVKSPEHLPGAAEGGIRRAVGVVADEGVGLHVGVYVLNVARDDDFAAGGDRHRGGEVGALETHVGAGDAVAVEGGVGRAVRQVADRVEVVAAEVGLLPGDAGGDDAAVGLDRQTRDVLAAGAELRGDDAAGAEGGVEVAIDGKAGEGEAAVDATEDDLAVGLEGHVVRVAAGAGGEGGFDRAVGREALDARPATHLARDEDPVVGQRQDGADVSEAGGGERGLHLPVAAAEGRVGCAGGSEPEQVQLADGVVPGGDNPAGGVDAHVEQVLPRAAEVDGDGAVAAEGGVGGSVGVEARDRVVAAGGAGEDDVAVGGHVHRLGSREGAAEIDVGPAAVAERAVERTVGVVPADRHALEVSDAPRLRDQHLPVVVDRDVGGVSRKRHARLPGGKGLVDRRSGQELPRLQPLQVAVARGAAGAFRTAVGGARHGGPPLGRRARCMSGPASVVVAPPNARATKLPGICGSQAGLTAVWRRRG
jgi:hypothetical protein